jgi:hypothetical protein
MSHPLRPDATVARQLFTDGEAMSIEERHDVEVALTALAIIARVAAVAEVALGADDSIWMQVPGTCLLVPLMPGPGPLPTWRIGREGLDAGLTVGELEVAAPCLRLAAELFTSSDPWA